MESLVMLMGSVMYGLGIVYYVKLITKHDHHK